jgi:hypothetical protein
MADLFTLQDPTKQYPLSKFKHQPQGIPGIARKMQPKPDTARSRIAEAVGFLTGRLWSRGGDSGIGRVAAIAFAREGADVVISYLPSICRAKRQTPKKS